MQAASLLDKILAGPEMQVIGVGENDFGVGVLQLIAGERLDAGLGAHGHEHRGLDNAVRRVQPTAARAGLLAYMQKLEFKCQFVYLLCAPPGIAIRYKALLCLKNVTRKRAGHIFMNTV